MKLSLFKKLIFSILTLSLVTFYSSGQTCSDAGIAIASADSVCYQDTTTLSLSGYIGAIQWQSSLDNIIWADETGSGSTTDSYDVNPQETNYYRAIVTDTGCLPDTGNVITLTVGTVPVPTANNVTRCGPGIVTLIGSGAGTLKWYNNATGGTPFGTGTGLNNYFPASTTVFLEDYINYGFGDASPLLVTEMILDPTDILELQNVSDQALDVTGWRVAIGNSYTDINLVNPNVQVLSGIIPPGGIITFTDNFSDPNYWGSNILWNPGAFPGFAAWAMILDDQNNLKDFVPLNWPDANIQAMSVVINGATITPSSKWTGPGADQTTATSGSSVQRIGFLDNDIATDHIIAAASAVVTNTNMTLPFQGFGCASPRIPVQVTITPSDAISITPSLPALCQGETSTLTASSNNSNYIYTWTPTTGLNISTGSVVQATPVTTTTYVVVGDDGTCANTDTITLNVGTPSAAGIASTFQDTICAGGESYLNLSGTNGTVQWQSFNGTAWVNETGPGSDSTTYIVSPTSNTSFWAVVTSGGCPSDTSDILDITVLSISDPIIADTAICGGGNISLTAIGQGNFHWYTDSTSNSPLYTGATYSFNAVATDTLWVEAFGGSNYSIGPINPGIGSQTTGTSNDIGCAFDVISNCTIESVKIFPQAAGQITINLRQIQNGPVLASYTTNVVAFLGQDIPLGFSVSPGTGYRLELAAGSVACTRNTNGATYPYQVANGPLEITGYYTPAFGSGTAYYWFYDWKVLEGCKSNKVPVIVTVNPYPATPTIGQIGNTLVSSASNGNQWILNGSILTGETGQSLNLTQTGTYTVAVTINGCTSLSSPFNVVTIGINEIDALSISAFPNPASNTITITSVKPTTFNGTITLVDLSGRVVKNPVKFESGNIIHTELDVTTLSPGTYLMEISGSEQSRTIVVNIVR